MCAYCWAPYNREVDHVVSLTCANRLCRTLGGDGVSDDCVYHRECVIDHLRRIGAAKDFLVGYLCPRGNHPRRSAPEGHPGAALPPCNGRISATHDKPRLKRRATSATPPAPRHHPTPAKPPAAPPVKPPATRRSPPPPRAAAAAAAPAVVVTPGASAAERMFGGGPASSPAGDAVVGMDSPAAESGRVFSTAARRARTRARAREVAAPAAPAGDTAASGVDYDGKEDDSMELAVFDVIGITLDRLLDAADDASRLRLADELSDLLMHC